MNKGWFKVVRRLFLNSLRKLRVVSENISRKNIDTTVEILAIILLGTLLILDVLSTSLVIKAGGYETNMLMESVVGIPMVHLFLKWIFLVLVVMAARFADRTVNGTGIYIMAVIIGWYSLVIAHNTLVFMKLLAGS